MYIPIGPSKKQLYKIIICLLLAIYLIFLGMYKPKAQVTIPTTAQLGGYLEFSPNEKYKTRNINAFSGYGKGYLIFTMFTERTTNQQQYQVGRGIDQISVVTDNYNYFTCEIGTTGFYLDNSYYDSLITAKCPVNLGTLTNIRFGATQDTTRVAWLTIGLGDYITFVPDDNSEVVNAIQQLQTQMAQQQIINNNIQNNTQNISDSINDSSIDSSSANDLTSNSAFQDSNGLDAIIKAPLNFIQSLTSSTCSAINLTIPYIDAEVSLPCMSTIYNKALGQQLVNLIALVINGVVLYRYCLKILQLVHNAKNPNKDELEVLDL